MSMIRSRGALLVVEGCDRAGKTTQCKKLVEALCQRNLKAVYMNFPDRRTEFGKLIDAYLTKKADYPDEVIHLLFTLNRWEAKNTMEKHLNEGTTLVIDRYAYSGVAFTAAKGLDLNWCKAPEQGLLKPDLVLYLDLSTEAIAKRMGFGDERYDIPEFQRRVNEMFMKLKDDKYWRIVNADETEESLTEELLKISTEVIENSKSKPLDKLW